MRRIELFLDSSALFAGIVSPDGAARVLLLLAEAGEMHVTVSEQVIAETERALARKTPAALPTYRQAIRQARLRIVRNPPPEQVAAAQGLVAHPPDAPIVLAAVRAQVDYLVTLNRKHFIDDPTVAQRSGLRIGTPGDALAWVREQLQQGTYARTSTSKGM
jgi:predicted nucleic acid-binding protein